jgi:4-azaleucine resistance transporter AzlC
MPDRAGYNSRPMFSRDDFLLGIRTMLPVQIGMIPFGLICGVAAASAGIPVPAALAMSALVFSGTAQLVSAQLYGAGAPAAVIVVSCVVVSLRFLMYSAALAPHLRELSERWRVLLSYLLTDQVFAAVIQRFRQQPEHRGHPWFFLSAGLMLWLPWQVSNAIGVLVGALVPASWSLDFVVPLSFLALVAPLLRDRVSLVAALGGGAGAIALAGMPMKLGLICGGLVGILAGMGAERLRR